MYAEGPDLSVVVFLAVQLMWHSSKETVAISFDLSHNHALFAQFFYHVGYFGCQYFYFQNKLLFASSDKLAWFPLFLERFLPIPYALLFAPIIANYF